MALPVVLFFFLSQWVENYRVRSFLLRHLQRSKKSVKITAQEKRAFMVEIRSALWHLEWVYQIQLVRIMAWEK